MSSGLSPQQCFSLFTTTLELSSPKLGISDAVMYQSEMTAYINRGMIFMCACVRENEVGNACMFLRSVTSVCVCLHRHPSEYTSACMCGHMLISLYFCQKKLVQFDSTDTENFKEISL